MSVPTLVGGSSSRPHVGPPPPRPCVPGAQSPHPMWVVRHPQSLQGQAPRLVNAYWNSPSNVIARGPCYNCDGKGHISTNCPSPRQGGASNAWSNNPPSQAPHQGARPQHQQAPKCGCIHYTIAEEILEDAEVLMGMLLINPIPLLFFLIPKQLSHSSTRSSCCIANYKCKPYHYHTT